MEIEVPTLIALPSTFSISIQHSNHSFKKPFLWIKNCQQYNILLKIAYREVLDTHKIWQDNEIWNGSIHALITQS